MEQSQLLAYSLLICLFTFLAFMGLQVSMKGLTIPDKEYAEIITRGEHPPIGYVSETQNQITFYSSIGFICAAVSLVLVISHGFYYEHHKARASFNQIG